jgi:nuclear pore complex protein Nup98-Nup96
MAGTLPPVGSIMPPAANDIMASQLAALESKRKELEEKDSFRSQPSPSAAVSAASLGERDSGGFGSFTPARLSFPTRRASPLSSAKIRPRGFASPPSDVTGGLSLSRLGNAGRPMPTPESAAAAASTRLIVAPTPKPKLKLILGNETPAKNSTTDPSLLDINGTNGNSREGGLGSVKPTRVTSPFATPEPVSTPTPAGGSHTTNGSKSPSSTTRADLYYQQAIGSPDALAVVTVSTSALPKLSKEGYICSPSIETMESLDPGDLAALPNFSVSRPGVGKVEWEGAVDVRGANLDKVVVIEPKSVSVYTEEEELGTKPRVGTKLNRPAVLTLEGVFPPDGAGSDGVEKFTRKVAKTTKKMDAELISYDPVGGEWKLKVKHFSRYALDDSDDDSDDGGAAGGEAIEVSPPEAMLQRKVDFQGTSPRASRGLAKVRKDTPYKSARSEGEEYFDMVSDEDMEDEDVFLEADQAYKRMQQNLARENELLQAKKKFELETTPFPEETEALFDHSEMLTDIFVPSLQDLEMAFSMPSITTKLLSATKSRTTNSRIDYGLRMGKSFRVAWGPDGSFLSIKKDGVITRSKPKFVDETSGSQLVMLHAHNSICQKISTNDDCPLLAIVPTRAAPMNKVLETYTNKIADSTSIEYNSFSLLSVINEAQVAKSSSRGGTDPDLDARCMFAFNQFLIASCSHDVLVELASQGSSLDFKSLLAAISSGNLQMAANVADQIGLPQLSILLTCPAARGCVLKEMRSWKNMPEDLKRCYRIIAGDLSMESRSCAFDWKRLMSMNLAYTERPRDLSSLVRQYEERVASGDAPFPSPNYLKAPSSGNETVESVMFKLMKLEGASDVKENLTIYIDPLGYTANPHDVSLAFHLAASISAMAGRPRLSPEEEESLIDGLKAQLLSSGLWQWCVYVSLCSLNPQSISPSFIDWRLNQAKSLISRHYQQSEESKRDFLESIGVPKEWFEDALACRSKNDGDAFSYIQHTVAAGNLQEATEAFEKTYLPTGLFVEKAKLLQFLDIFDAFVSVESADSLVALLPDLVDVANAIELLEGSPQDEINAAGPKLLKLLDGVEGTLCKYESSEVFSKESLDMIPDIYPIPVGAFVVQAAEVTSFMRLQIMALQSGNSSKNTAGELTKLARSGRSKNSNIQRYLI